VFTKLSLFRTYQCDQSFWLIPGAYDHTAVIRTVSASHDQLLNSNVLPRVGWRRDGRTQCCCHIHGRNFLWQGSTAP